MTQWRPCLGRGSGGGGREEGRREEGRGVAREGEEQLVEHSRALALIKEVWNAESFDLLKEFWEELAGRDGTR